MSKTFVFQGSKERLHRMVVRYQGSFLSNQEFELRWQPSRYKKQHVLTFRIRCRYEKAPSGYRITYRIMPTGVSWLRLAAQMIFWAGGIFWLWDPAEPAGAVAAVLLAIACVVSDYWQLRDSEKEFLQRFTAVTR